MPVAEIRAGVRSKASEERRTAGPGPTDGGPGASEFEGRYLEPLVRALVERADLFRGLPADGGHPSGSHVLLDLEVDGVRCVLIRTDAGPGRVRARLSPREQEITRMVADGSTTKAIAETLGISSWTVSAHLRRVFAKLGVSTRAAMVAALVVASEDATGILGERRSGPERFSPDRRARAATGSARAARPADPPGRSARAVR
jgi:DNA-binding CsgD family transcriptional regulator